MFGERVKPGNRKKLNILLFLATACAGLYYFGYAPEGTNTLVLIPGGILLFLLGGVFLQKFLNLFRNAGTSAEEDRADHEVLNIALVLAGVSAIGLIFGLLIGH